MNVVSSAHLRHKLELILLNMQMSSVCFPWCMQKKNKTAHLNSLKIDGCYYEREGIALSARKQAPKL